MDIHSTFDIKNKMICPTEEDATVDAASFTLHALYVFFKFAFGSPSVYPFILRSINFSVSNFIYYNDFPSVLTLCFLILSFPISNFPLLNFRLPFFGLHLRCLLLTLLINQVQFKDVAALCLLLCRLV